MAIHNEKILAECHQKSSPSNPRIETNNFRKFLRNTSLILVMLGCTYSVMAKPGYRITDLGFIGPYYYVDEYATPMTMVTPGGSVKRPIAINDSGYVTLSSIDDDYASLNKLNSISSRTGVFHSFRLKANSVINFETDDIGFLLYPQENTHAVAINNFGQVVGLSRTVVDGANYTEHGFRTEPNKAINSATDDLGALIDHMGYSEAHGINDSGQVVGVAETASHNYHAFRTAPNKAINPKTDDLGTLEGGEVSVAYAINNSGQVVGESSHRAFRTAPNKAINPATDDLGSLGGGTTKAYAINDSGQVVGMSWAASDIHAFRTGPNKAINPVTDDLGTLGGSCSIAYAINSTGDVVGISSIGEDHGQDPRFRPFLYTKGSMYDLNDLIPSDSEWRTLILASGINKSGQIVGYGVLKTGEGQLHAFRLDKIE